MAAAILHNHPLQDYFRDDFEGLCGQGDSWCNERFAVYHGVAICAEDSGEDKLKSIFRNPHVTGWADDFAALLRSGSPCRQSLIHIFGTLCLGFFPENLGHGPETP
jgi:hypothetical protein